MITAEEIVIKNKISLKQLISISQIAKAYNGTIKIVKNKQAINVTNVTKLTAFFLTLSQNSRIKLVAEGANMKEAIRKIEHLFNYSAKPQQDKNFMTNMQIS